MSAVFYIGIAMVFLFKGMLPRKRILTALLLLFMDVVFVVVNIIAEFIVDVLLALALLIGIAFRFAQRKKPHLRKEKVWFFYRITVNIGPRVIRYNFEEGKCHYISRDLRNSIQNYRIWERNFAKEWSLFETTASFSFVVPEKWL